MSHTDDWGKLDNWDSVKDIIGNKKAKPKENILGHVVSGFFAESSKQPYKTRLLERDVNKVNKKYHKVMLSIDLSDIETLYSVGRDIEHDIVDVTNDITKIMFAQREALTGTLERVASVFGFVAKKKYIRALEASGFSSLHDFVETERSTIDISVNTIGTDLTRYKSLKEVNNKLCERLDDVIAAVEKTVEMLQSINIGRHKDTLSDDIIPLKSRLGQLYDIRGQIEVQGIKIDDSINRLKRDIDSCSNAGFGYLSQICLLADSSLEEAKYAWTGISTRDTILDNNEKSTANTAPIAVKINNGVNKATVPAIVVGGIGSLIAIKPLMLVAPIAIVVNILTQGKGGSDTVGLWTLMWNNPRTPKTNRYTAFIEYGSLEHKAMKKALANQSNIVFSAAQLEQDKEFYELYKCGFFSEVAPFGIKIPMKLWHNTPLRTNAGFIGGIFNDVWNDIKKDPVHLVRRGIHANGYCGYFDVLKLFGNLGILKTEERSNNVDEYTRFYPGPNFKRYEVAMKYADATREDSDSGLGFREKIDNFRFIPKGYKEAFSNMKSMLSRMEKEL